MASDTLDTSPWWPWLSAVAEKQREMLVEATTYCLLTFLTNQQ